MAVPELVICPAGDGFKKYPGGVVAVCAADYLGAARGTLSTETDALSACGTVVRDTQQVNNIRTNQFTVYSTALNTLVMDDLPLVAGRGYDVWVTYRIEGQTDLTDGALLRAGTNENWNLTGLIGIHTQTGGTSNQDNFLASPPPLPYYRASMLQFLSVYVAGDDVYLRMGSESGTSIEWLLDQVVFFPSTAFGGGYEGTHYPKASGATLFLAANTQDGNDGGDDNGKFTWFSGQPVDTFTSRGDYQRYADGDDAEYFTQVTKADGQSMWFHRLEKGPAWMYSVNTAMYRGERVWTDDTFDNRDTSATDQDMGISPEGFGYRIGSSVGGGPGNTAHCNGDGTATLAVNHPLGRVEFELGANSQGATATLNQGMKVQLYDQWKWTTTWEWVHGDTNPGWSWLRFYWVNGAGGSYIIEFNLGGKYWNFIDPLTGYSANQDISAWFGKFALTGVTVEVRRYRLLIRVWDASGPEPSTWDFDVFLDKTTSPSGPYPYSDDEVRSSAVSQASTSFVGHDCEITFVGFADFPCEITVHSNKVEHDPRGDPADMVMRVERPPGTSLGDQVVPFGTGYCVYWGKRDWSDRVGGDDYLEWSAKVWNDPAAAEIQRAEVDDYYFFWFDQPFNLVSMNWRSSDRRTGSNRVLVSG